MPEGLKTFRKKVRAAKQPKSRASFDANIKELLEKHSYLDPRYVGAGAHNCSSERCVLKKACPIIWVHLIFWSIWINPYTLLHYVAHCIMLN